MDTTNDATVVMRFGQCELLPRERELRVAGKPVHLGGRAFDLLTMVVEAGGKLVTKDEILSRVWRGTIVEENTLHAQVSALRKALGIDRHLFKSISGHGYQCTSDVAQSAFPAADPVRPRGLASPIRAMTNIGAPVTEMIGRDSELGKVLDLAGGHRLLTLIGPGGVGKSRLAIQAAREVMSHFADGVWLADLARVCDPAQVADKLAEVAGFQVCVDSPSQAHGAVASKQMLVVLDNCEHLIDAAAASVEAILRTNPAVRIVATSREPLRIDGECIYCVPPLDVPAHDAPHMGSLSHNGAVKLFLDRASLTDPSWSNKQIAALTAICRSTDGLPLAIELAAARLPTLGIEELARRCGDSLSLLAGGWRTALPRHQSMRECLNWSYAMLSKSERIVLHHLSTFAGRFILESATEIATADGVDTPTVVDALSDLVSKSLVTAHIDDATTRYSLLCSTRAYVRERWAEASGVDEMPGRARPLAEAAESLKSITRPLHLSYWHCAELGFSNRLSPAPRRAVHREARRGARPAAQSPSRRG